jgi:hypothetical protein
MRRRILLLAVLATCVTAGAAHASARPLRPADGALLKRGGTVEERIAEGVAKRLTRLAPTVRCGSLGVAAPPGLFVGGVTLLPPRGPADYFLVTPKLCNYLAWFRQDPGRYDPAGCADSTCFQEASWAAFALGTISHESYHVLGYRKEAQVECYGMQSIWFVATSLGAPAAEAQRIASYYWKTSYADRQTSTPTYWSAECRDGGKYDLRPASPNWPS